MASEIERKFLPPALPPRANGAERVAIEQGYLALDGETEVRLRRAGDALRLTVKHGRGESREEVEVELTADQFAALWPLAAGRSLRKTRLLVPLGGGLRAEIDRYEGELEGLLVAEVEFPTEDESRAWEPPGWIGREVTGDAAYANQALALDGAPRELDPAPASRENGEVPSVGEKPGASAAYGLEAGEAAPDGIRRIAAGRAAEALGKLGAIEAEGAAAIHGARKDLKKLRAVLRLVRAELPKKLYREQNRRYRDAGRLLSDTRDAEVKVETLDDLEERFGREFPEAVAEHWRRDLERERYAAVTDTGGELAARVERARAAIEEGRAEILRWPLERDSFALLEAGVLSAYAEGREALVLVREEPSADHVHEWRKRAKDLWYQLRILRELWPGVLGETASEAHILTDLLGDHHDLAVLAEDLGSRDTIDPGAIGELIRRRQDELLERAVELGERLYAEKPPAWAKRLGRYWKIAHR
jgi:CYTH domain-containing protein/CHAD domain-containing protein